MYGLEDIVRIFVWGRSPIVVSGLYLSSSICKCMCVCVCMGRRHIKVDFTLSVPLRHAGGEEM